MATNLQSTAAGGLTPGSRALARTRIALVLDSFDPRRGGSEQWSVAFARYLLARGHDLHVLAFEAGDHGADHGLKLTLHLLPADASPLARARRVEHAIAALRPDVVHDTGTGWSADVFHPLTGSRLLAQARLVATHSPLMRLRAAVSPVSILRRRRMARLEARQLRNARRIIAVSRMVARLLASRFGVAEERMTVIPNGVELARFAPTRLAALRHQARAQLDAQDEAVFLISAHNLVLKGVDTAMRALAPLVAAGTDSRLIVAGGEAGPEWLALAERLGVRHRVAFLGPVADMPRLFAAADVLVHPTRWDACSLSTIEAGAAGLPVITTAMNGASELIEDDRTGYVLPDPEDAAALSARMRALLDPGLRRTVGEAAREAAAGHDITRNFAAVEDVLLEFAKTQRSRPMR